MAHLKSSFHQALRKLRVKIGNEHSWDHKGTRWKQVDTEYPKTEASTRVEQYPKEHTYHWFCWLSGRVKLSQWWTNRYLHQIVTWFEPYWSVNMYKLWILAFSPKFKCFGYCNRFQHHLHNMQEALKKLNIQLKPHEAVIIPSQWMHMLIMSIIVTNVVWFLISLMYTSEPQAPATQGWNWK